MARSGNAATYISKPSTSKRSLGTTTPLRQKKVKDEQDATSQEVEQAISQTLHELKAERAALSSEEFVDEAGEVQDPQGFEELVDDADDLRLPASPEEAAVRAREVFGDALPEGVLGEEAYRVYERLYGTPVRFENDGEVEEDLDESGGMELLREGEDGVLEEVELRGEIEGASGMTPADTRLAEDIHASLSGEDANVAPALEQEEAPPDEDEGDSFQRTHPLTLANRFTTSPSTLPLPNSTLVAPIEAQLANISNTHLKQAAHRTFGGVGLPYSASTPSIAKTMQAKPIALDAGQSSMSEIEGDVFLAAVVPGVYAAVMSVLVETRKRLGSAWAEDLIRKAEKGELRILDAGGGGAGVLAVRELLRAEWERMHEDSTDVDSGMALAEADGKVGGASLDAPLGHATVLTGSDVLRKKVSKILENTTFIPRLPDYEHTQEAKRSGKFDIVIAPHTIWPLKQDYMRKIHLQNLWSLSSTDGGVLLLLEKGIPRGFELIAAAREQLLSTRIASAQDSSHDIHSQPLDRDPLIHEKKEKGVIIAPCTNHALECPMYHPKGLVKGRRDICHFSQRYVRPNFLQTILGARDKNFEDVKFSYLAVMRGKDLRLQEHEDQAMQQGAEATEKAFQGYEHAGPDEVGGLSLPRTVLPPLKRRGHTILDLCTPSGTLERWTVPRSFSKQAFRDARKSSWGDLWALGAKTRVPRNPKIKKRKSDADLDVVAKGKGKGKGGGDARAGKKDKGLGYDEFGRIVVRGEGEEEAAMPGVRGRTVKLVDGVSEKKVKKERKKEKKREGRGKREGDRVRDVD